MRATVLWGPGDVRIEQVPDAALLDPTDAVIRVLRACICGSAQPGARGDRAFSDVHGSPMTWSAPDCEQIVGTIPRTTRMTDCLLSNGALTILLISRPEFVRLLRPQVRVGRGPIVTERTLGDTLTGA